MPSSRHPWLWGALTGAVVLLCGAALAALSGLALLVPQFDGRMLDGATLALDRMASPLSRANRIVVIDDAGAMRTLDPNGSGRRLFNLSDLTFRFPAWSPDGSSLAVIGSEGSETGVYVLADADDPQATALYLSDEQPPFYLYWAPDGNMVSFLANDIDAGIGLWLAQRDPKPMARKIATGQPFYWQWLPNSEQLLAHSGSDDDGRLDFLSVEGAISSTTVNQPGAFQAPGVSPDGRFLAYAEASPDGASQVVVESQRDGARWTASHAGVAAMNWSPAANVLAFISPAAEAPHYYGPLRLLDAGTGEERTLSTRTALAFFWSPDGRSVAFLAPAGSGGDSGAGISPDYSSALRTAAAQEDGLLLDLWLADASSGRLRLLTTFQPTPLFLGQFLPYFDQYNLSHRLWSPASDALVLPVVEADGVERVYIVPANGQPPRPLIEGSVGFWSPN